MPNWPESLRFCPVAGSYQERPVDAVLRTEVDAGPDLTRKRFTAVPVNISFTLPKMSRAQFVVFRTWFSNDLDQGALTFNAKHPLTGENGVFQFRGPYSVSKPGRSISVSIEVVLLP